MKKAILGIAAATVVLFLWGFLYWGLGPYRTMIWHQTADDVAAGQALLEYFPQNGTYYVPGFDRDQAENEELFNQGPVAFVHMLSANGRPAFDVSIMIQGFMLNAVVVVLIVLILHQVKSAVPSYWGQVKLISLIGLTAAVLIDCGAAVWWQIDWPWKLYQAFYDFSAWVVAGLVLAGFVGPEEPVSSTT